jgi:hypothetical protein
VLRSSFSSAVTLPEVGEALKDRENWEVPFRGNFTRGG